MIFQPYPASLRGGSGSIFCNSTKNKPGDVSQGVSEVLVLLCFRRYSVSGDCLKKGFISRAGQNLSSSEKADSV